MQVRMPTENNCKYFKRYKSLQSWWKNWSIDENAWRITDKLGKPVNIWRRKIIRDCNRMWGSKNNNLNVKKLWESLGKMNETFLTCLPKKIAIKLHMKWRLLYHATYHFSLKLCQNVHMRFICIHPKNEHIAATIIYVLLDMIKLYFYNLYLHFLY